MIIEGKRIFLRSIKSSDAKYFLKWTEDQNNLLYSLWEFQIPKTKADYEEYIKKSGLSKGKISFIICDKETSKPIGETGLNNIDLVNRRSRTFTLVGDTQSRNKGLAFEAKSLLLEYAFKTLNLNRLYCSVTDINKEWITSLTNFGFKIEGREREASYRMGEYHDKILLGITRSDWEKKPKIKTYRKKNDEKEFFAKVINPKSVYSHIKNHSIFQTIQMKIYTYFPSDDKKSLIRIKSEKIGKTEKIYLDYKRKYREDKQGDRYRRESKEISLEISSFENAQELIKELGYRPDKHFKKVRYQCYINNKLISLDQYFEPDKDWWIEIENTSSKEVTKILQQLDVKY